MSSKNQHQHNSSTLKSTSKAQIIQERLKSFTGTEMFYQLPLFKTRFTDGVKYLSEVAECFWLVTDASVIAKSLKGKNEFITIDFKRLSKVEQIKSKTEAVILYTDGNNNLLEKHGYFVTDFPLDDLRLFFVNDTLMLPSEY
jgi:hypothetical protein